MCFGGGKAPSPTPPPAPTPTAVAPQESVVKGADYLKQLRYGLASTIKTSSRGLTGSGSNLNSQTNAGKQKLGA